MQNNISKDLPEIGKVNYLLNRKIKGIRIKVQSFKDITISVPRGVSIADADRFLYKKKEWILKNLAKIKRYERHVLIKQKEVDVLDELQAKQMLVERTGFLADANNFQYRKISIKRQRTRWGSCSSKGNINLNINLAHLPSSLIDYVIFHELVHTRINGHSNSFWFELDKYAANSKKKNKELKLYQYLLHRE